MNEQSNILVEKKEKLNIKLGKKYKTIPKNFKQLTNKNLSTTSDWTREDKSEKISSSVSTRENINSSSISHNSDSHTSSLTDSRSSNSNSNDSHSISESECSKHSFSKSVLSSNNKNSCLSLNKYIIKSSDFYRKNILLVNDDREINENILGDLLHKLNIMKNVDKIYNNYIHVLTDNIYKKSFKRLLLDNPYLHFSNFDVKNNLTNSKLREISESDKRNLYIIDFSSLIELNSNVFNIIDDLLKYNVQLIVLCTNYDKFVSVIYKLLNNGGSDKSKCLLIHKPNKFQSLQRQFFNKICKKIIDIQDNLDHTHYCDFVNNENNDIRHIIIKDSVLYYN